MNGKLVTIEGKSGRLVVLIPEDAEVIKKFSPEDIYGDSGPQRADFALIFRRRDKIYLVVIEETSGPRKEDLNKIDNIVRDLRGIVGGNNIEIKIIHHHGGVHPNLYRLAMGGGYEILRCNKPIDLVNLMRKRDLF